MNRFALLSLLASLPGLAFTGNLYAQGMVQERDPRRPPPLQASGGCELWIGDIHGNDPSAEITVQICTEGDVVTGTFLWSSLESGWDRRTFEGHWDAAHTTLTAHDTAMLELHPLNGWRLCTADRYELRKVSETRLEGTYESAPCHDRGNLAMNLRGPAFAPAAAPTNAVVPPSPLAQRGGRMQGRLLQCSHRPGAETPAGGAMCVALGAGVLGVCATRRRRRRA